MVVGDLQLSGMKFGHDLNHLEVFVVFFGGLIQAAFFFWWNNIHRNIYLYTFTTILAICR